MGWLPHSVPRSSVSAAAAALWQARGDWTTAETRTASADVLREFERSGSKAPRTHRVSTVFGRLANELSARRCVFASREMTRQGQSCPVHGADGLGHFGDCGGAML